MAEPLYIITGIYGFVGRTIAERLSGARIRGLASHPRPDFPLPDGTELVFGDIRDVKTIAALFEGAGADTVVFHAAAVVSVKKHDVKCEDVNINGTRNIVDACIAHGVRRLIHFASVDALRSYGKDVITEPISYSADGLPTSYARSKAISASIAAEAAANGLSAVILLPSAIMGPGDYHSGFITQMIRIYVRGIPPVSVEGGYDFVDVRDVAEAAISAIDLGKSGNSYILSNRFADVTTVFDTLADHYGRKKTKKVFSIKALYAVAPLTSFFMQLFGKQPPITTEAVRLMAAHPTYSHAKAAAELGFSPRPLFETITETADFISSCRNAKKEHRKIDPATKR